MVEAARWACASWRGRSAGVVGTQLAAMSSVSSSAARTSIGPRPQHDDRAKGSKQADLDSIEKRAACVNHFIRPYLQQTPEADSQQNNRLVAKTARITAGAASKARAGWATTTHTQGPSAPMQGQEAPSDGDGDQPRMCGTPHWQG